MLGSEEDTKDCPWFLWEPNQQSQINLTMLQYSYVQGARVRGETGVGEKSLAF